MAVIDRTRTNPVVTDTRLPSGTRVAEEVRLVILREKLQRLIAGVTRVNAEILTIERQIAEQKTTAPS